jgi:hypothetical protein
MFEEPLRDLGVELVNISNIPIVPHPSSSASIEDGEIKLDLSVLDSCDILFFRRYYNTSIKCSLKGCAFRLPYGQWKDKRIDEHERLGPEHLVTTSDVVTRPVWAMVREHWKKAIVYDTDDLHLGVGVQPWNGYKVDVDYERDLIADMVRRATLVTVSTPALAQSYGVYNKNIRVIRNAIDISAYTSDSVLPKRDRPLVLYYGGAARMRDFLGQVFTGDPDDGTPRAGRAIEWLRRSRLISTAFVGLDEPQLAPLFRRLFDEVYDYVEGPRNFARLLASINADIGVAPLGGDEFDRHKSELHWLEYAVLGIPCVAQRFSHNPSAYSVIRNGEDGFLAKSEQEWRDYVGKLARDPDLRARIGERARERVLREYDHRERAKEWAEAFFSVA